MIGNTTISMVALSTGPDIEIPLGISFSKRPHLSSVPLSAPDTLDPSAPVLRVD